jgi:hypothetical protein
MKVIIEGIRWFRVSAKEMHPIAALPRGVTASRRNTDGHVPVRRIPLARIIREDIASAQSLVRSGL